MSIYRDPDPTDAAGGPDPKDTKDAKDTQDTDVELDFNGTKTKLSREKIVEHLNQGAGATQILAKLYEAGLIDEAGNPKKAEEKKEDKKDEDEGTKTNKRVEDLEKQVEDMKRESNVQKFTRKLNEALDTAAQSFDLTKNDPDIAQDIRDVVLAQYYQDPSKNIAQLYKAQVDKKMKHYEKYKSKLNDTNDGEGGSGTFTLDKPLGLKDLKSGLARKAAEALMNGAKNIG